MEKSKSNEKVKKGFKKSKIHTKKISNIELEDEDPCAHQDEPEMVQKTIILPGLDPRFQQQNQTKRCYVMYTDFHQCEYLLGEGHEACEWFKRVFTSICPQAWVERWDTLRNTDPCTMPWGKAVKFPEAPYGKYQRNH